MFNWAKVSNYIPMLVMQVSELITQDTRTNYESVFPRYQFWHPMKSCLLKNQLTQNYKILLMKKKPTLSKTWPHNSNFQHQVIKHDKANVNQMQNKKIPLRWLVLLWWPKKVSTHQHNILCMIFLALMVQQKCTQMNQALNGSVSCFFKCKAFW